MIYRLGKFFLGPIPNISFALALSLIGVYSFAIGAPKAPSDQVSEMPTLLEKIGIMATHPASNGEIAHLKIKTALVVETVEGAAALAGILPGDVLIWINGRETKFGSIKTLPEGFPNTIVLTISRADERIPVAVQLPPKYNGLYIK